MSAFLVRQTFYSLYAALLTTLLRVALSPDSLLLIYGCIDPCQIA